MMFGTVSFWAWAQVCLWLHFTSSSGVVIGLSTEHTTSHAFYPVRSIAAAGLTGPATAVIQGMGLLSLFVSFFEVSELPF